MRLPGVPVVGAAPVADVGCVPVRLDVMPKDKGKAAPETKDKNHLVKPENYDKAVQRDTDRALGKGPQLSTEELRRIYGDQRKNGK